MDEKEYIKRAIEEVRDVSNAFLGRSEVALLKKWFNEAVPFEEAVKLLLEHVKKTKSARLRNISPQEYPVQNPSQKIVSQIKQIVKNLNLPPHILKEIESAFALEPLEREKRLAELEAEFFALLFKNVPDADRLLLKAYRQVEEFRYFWSEAVFDRTLRALVKRYLREEYEVPEFTGLGKVC